MIEKLQIRNVGTNKKLDIEFSPQATTIIGKNTIGKSWALRALRLVALNKPPGYSYINWDANKAKIRLSIDSKKVIRTRSKTTNSYRLSGKKKPYVAFGNNVPNDIAKLLNVSEINFQGQHESPFWFCKTAGEVSRQLNSIVNLELIDSTLTNILSELNTTRTVIKITEKALTKTIQQKKDLLYVKDLNSDLENVEKLQKQYEQDTREHASIAEKVEICINTRNSIENRLEQVSDGLKAMSTGRQYLKIRGLVGKLSELVESGIDLQETLENKPPSFRPLEKLKKGTECITNQFDSLDILITSAKDRKEDLCQMETCLKDLQEELTEVTKGRCPLCGKPMAQK